MPGTILLEDAQKFYGDRLRQHAQDAFQAMQQANQPPLQNVQAPSLPNPQIDPNEIIGRLQQHAQDAFQAAQQANQPPLAGVQVDPNDIIQRLQQHAQDAFQAVDQNVQPISQGLQQAVQPVAQAAQAVGQGVQQAVQPTAPTPPAPAPAGPPVERGGDLRAYARQAAQRAGIDPDIFERQIQQESGFNVTAKSGAGAQGIAQFMPATAAGLGLDPNDPYASLDAAARMDAENLRKYGGDWSKVLAAYNAGPGAVDQYGGVPPFEETKRYVRDIIGGAGQVVERGRQAVAGAVLPVLSQFGDKQLTAAEAYAACGPAAAVRFAQMFGRNPTLREATDMASNLGWTRDTGMAGLESESRLFDAMHIPHRVVGADWRALAREAQSGNPVTISTPGHYFTADSYDPASGAFHVGSSGTDLRGGAEWMTPAQMEQRMGALQGGLAADNPGTPAPSPIAGGGAAITGLVGQARQAVQQGGRAITSGLQLIDSAVQSAASAVGQASQGVGDVLSGAAAARAQERGYSPEFKQFAAEVANTPVRPGDAGTLLLEGGQPFRGQTLAGDAQVGQQLADATIDKAKGAGWEPTPEQESSARRALGLLTPFNVSAMLALGGPRLVQSLSAIALQSAGTYAGEEAARRLGVPEEQVPLAGLAGSLAAPLAGGALEAAATNPAVQQALRTSQRGEAEVGFAMGRPTGGVPPPEVPVPEPATRMYHGTSGAFDRPDPSRFDANGLYGPGYYVTSSPEVAGGAVSRGRFGVNPETGRTSTYNPETGKFDTYMTGQGELVSPGYAQARPNLSMADIADIAQRAANEADQNVGYFGNSVGSDIRGLIRRLPLFDARLGTSAAGTAEQELLSILSRDSPNPEALLKKLAPDIYGRGGNVRAVDVPQNLNVLDAEQRIGPDTLQRVADALSSRFGPEEGRNYLLNARTQGGQTWTGETLVQTLRSYLRDIPGESLAWPTDQAPSITNKVLADAGYDGISYAGGKRIPMADEFGTPIEHQATVIFPESLDKIRNAISGRQGGQIQSGLAVRLGGGVAGGVLGNVTAPEDADPRDRAARILTGAGLGLGLTSAATGFRGPIEQQVLENLRQGGLQAASRVPPPPPPGSALRQQWLTGTGPWAAAAARGPIAQAVDITKQSILTNPATHIANVIGNTIELARQPIALAMGGRGDDALAGLVSVGRGLPEAASNALSSLRGQQLPTLATAGSTIPRSGPIFRALSAADAFTRTLGEYQGMAAEASRLLREAGLQPSDAGAAAYLASHAQDLYQQGSRAGAQSVFGRVASAAQGKGVLENIFKTYANAKEGLLNSPRLRDQAMGALMDFGIPFSGVPVQMLEIGLNRLPVASQATGAVRAARALKAGNLGEAQRAVGETGLETALQLMIAKQVADGNITGPDDPDHPNAVRVGGNWMSMNDWGAYALPMQIMASFADGYEKGGHDVPAGSNVGEYYGPRFAAALNASLKPFQQGIPGENLIRLVSNIGQGGATAGALGVAQDAVNRITVPGAARFVENLTDPLARDINRKGVESLWQGPLSNWPGLAQMLPAKIDPTTGDVLQKARAGPGTLLGGQQDVESAITREANRLKEAGYKINPPKTYPDTVTVSGAQVKLNPDEQRRVTQITGKVLGDFATRLDQPDYQQSTENRKAQLMQSYLNAAERARTAAVREVLGLDELRRRVIAGQRTVGRLNAQAGPPEIPFLSSSSLSAQEQQQQAGAA